MSEFIRKRKEQLVRHFLKLNKIFKKFIPFFGQISALLGLLSVILGKDVDVVGKIIDDILDPFLERIPGIGEHLAGGSSGYSFKVHDTGPFADEEYYKVKRRSDGSWYCPEEGIDLDPDGSFEESETRQVINFYKGEDGATYLQPNSRRALQDKGVLPGGSGSSGESSSSSNSSNSSSSSSKGDSDEGSDSSAVWTGKLRKMAPIIGIILLFAALGFGALQVVGGGSSVGLGFLSGIIGIVSSPLLIGGLVFIGVAAAIFKFGGSSAGGKFLVAVPLVLLIFGAIASFAVGGSPLSYLGYGEQTADSYAGALFGEAQGAARVYGQAKARVFCLLKGPACLRQWQLNNTQRPGSEDVGETYGLKIDSFQVGQGEQLDIAYKDSGSAIPVSFTISNPRHGLKGIDALNVSYRIRIIDSDRDQTDPYCDTGWINVQEAYNIDGEGGENDIYPGTSASTGFLTLDQAYMQTNSDNIKPAVEGRAPEPLTLESCEMLQPALGQNRVALLNLKYDYFSQATLDFEAMSMEYFQSNEDIEKSIKESETADTPVKAAINVNSPVLFSESDTGERDPRPFAAKATLNTDKNDIQYKVRDFSILNSDYLSKLGGGNCQFTKAEEPGQKMGLDGTAKSNIIQSSDDKDRPDSFYWFDIESAPPIFGCVMKLDEEGADGNGINEISPSGETLTMRIKTNYTVSKRERLGSLNVYNSICSRVDCPLIVTVRDNRSDEASNYNFKTVCTGLDAGNGCSIVSASASDEGWSEVDGDYGVLNRNPPGDAVGADTNIERGEIAVGIKNSSGIKHYGGLRKDKFEQIASSINRGEARATEDDPYQGEAVGVVYYTTYEGEKELEIVDLRRKDDGTCEYTSYHLNSQLIWDNCELKKDDSGDSSAGWFDVITTMPII